MMSARILLFLQNVVITPRYVDFLDRPLGKSVIIVVMRGLRQFIQSRRSSAALVACLAYALAFQALTASIGLGMSAFAAPAGLVICSHAPVADHERQKPGSAPECPFCYAAAQCANHMAFMGGTQTSPAYTAVLAPRIVDPTGSSSFVPQFRRLDGNPRAPPAFSV
jgi:hypothetical protein